MFRLLVFLILLGLCTKARAADLSSRLLLLYPGEETAAVETRAYLTGKLENVFRQLRYTDRIDRKSPEQQVRRITQRLYQGTLRTYAPMATLRDAFANGTYNDATATQLLGLTLDHFNLPYVGYVDHWESYLVVPLATQSITLRHPATLPHRADTERSYRREYLALVRTALELPLADLSAAAADSVFYRYHYRPTQRLNFRQLAAYGQYRRAEHAYRDGNFPGARTYLAAALAEDWQPGFYLLDRAAVLQHAALHPPVVSGYIRELFELWRDEPANAYLPAALLRYFDERQQQMLATDRLDEAVNLLYSYAARGPKDQATWREELHVLQQLRLLQYYQQRGQDAQALQIAEALYQSEPDNQRYQDYVAELNLVSLRHRYADPGELLDQANDAARERPFLRDYDRFADIVLRESALTVRDRFAADDPTNALTALKSFRSKLAAYPNGHDRALWTLTAFVAASNYYFAREAYGPARDHLEEALRYDPTSAFLLHQRDLLARY